MAPIATEVEEENPVNLHQGFRIESWEVELYGTLRCRLWKRIDKALDEVQGSIFCEGKVRTWMNGNIQVFLPAPDENVVYVFTHILQHFF